MSKSEGFSWKARTDGKTLTVLFSPVAVESGWTFIHLQPPLTKETFMTAYALAQLYGQTILVVEDNDSLFQVRDANMNQLLETIDGSPSQRGHCHLHYELSQETPYVLLAEWPGQSSNHL